MSSQKTYPAALFHTSNAITYLSLLGGFFAYLAAVVFKSWPLVGASMALSVLSDLFDGRFARLFSRTEIMRNFGVQIDSLVDAVVFGAVPVLCIATLDPPSTHWELIALLAIGFFYNLCALTRLGFYNVFAAQTDDFIGLPTTQMGLAWALFVFARPSLYPALGFMIAGGIAMVSGVPIPRPRNKAFALICAITLAVGLLHLFTAIRG